MFWITGIYYFIFLFTQAVQCVVPQSAQYVSVVDCSFTVTQSFLDRKSYFLDRKIKFASLMSSLLFAKPCCKFLLNDAGGIAATPPCISVASTSV